MVQKLIPLCYAIRINTKWSNYSRNSTESSRYQQFFHQNLKFRLFKKFQRFLDNFGIKI